MCLLTDYNLTLFTQDHIRLLMEGRPYEELHEFCDFTLAQQNEATAAKGVPPSAPADFQPVVKKSVCYIVAAVLFNEKNEVVKDHSYTVGDGLDQIYSKTRELAESYSSDPSQW